MKKIFPLVLLVALLVTFSLSGYTEPGATGSQEQVEEDSSTATAEEVETVVPSPLLKNVVYVRVITQFNGIEFYKGVKSPRDIDIKEFNLDRVEIRLKEDTIPLSNDNVRVLYSRAQEHLKKAGLRILNIHQQDQKQSTLVPTLTLSIDAIATSDSNYVVLVNLSLNKWISTWSGKENLQALVVVWWHKVLLTATQELLAGSLEEAADEVMAEFLNQIAIANPKPENTDTVTTGSTL